VFQIGIDRPESLWQIETHEELRLWLAENSNQAMTASPSKSCSERLFLCAEQNRFGTATMIFAPTRTQPRTDTTPDLRFATSRPSDLTGIRAAPSSSIDDEMCVVVERHLRLSDYRPVRTVRCFVADGVATLFGTLPSFHMKQVAQTLVSRIELVRRVENHCEVVYPKNEVPLKSAAGSEAEGN